MIASVADYFREWDTAEFVLPAEYRLDHNSDLSAALHVFYAAGGYEFFQVADPKYYATHWLDFMGNLYAEILEGRYPATKNHTLCL